MPNDPAAADEAHSPARNRARVSARHGAALLALAVLALVPVAIHSYAEVESDDCANPRVLVTKSSSRDPARDRFMSRQLDAVVWREGRVAVPGSRENLTYTIVRSYNGKRLYYRPEYRLFPQAEPRAHEIEWTGVGDGAETIPIHRAYYGRTADRGVHVVAWLLVYDGKPVDNPYAAQLLAAPRRMLTGRVPVTLFLVRGTFAASESSSAQEAARAWLTGSWQRYRAICGA